MNRYEIEQINALCNTAAKNWGMEAPETIDLFALREARASFDVMYTFFEGVELAITLQEWE